MDLMPKWCNCSPHPPPPSYIPNEVPVISIDSIPSDFAFTVPVKKITCNEDLQTWVVSDACVKLINFLTNVNDSIKGKPSTSSLDKSATVAKLEEMLEKFDHLIDSTPPVQQPMRFGNKAFRTWHSLFAQESESQLQDLCQAFVGDQKGLAEELLPYLLGGFGDSTRIDYGSGHELSFLSFLLCLQLAGLLTSDDYEAMVFFSFVFFSYFKVSSLLMLIGFCPFHRSLLFLKNISISFVD
eukprot:Sdes_comp18059_c0_seq3m7448